jgi:hypothetical protein
MAEKMTIREKYACAPSEQLKDVVLQCGGVEHAQKKCNTSAEANTKEKGLELKFNSTILI